MLHLHTHKLCWDPWYYNCPKLWQSMLANDCQSEMANHTSSFVEIINIIYLSRIEIKIFHPNDCCFQSTDTFLWMWKLTLNYQLSWQWLSINRFDWVLWYCCCCYHISETQAVAAVITVGNKTFGKIWKHHD